MFRNKSVCTSGVKQIKVVKALFDYDRLTHSSQGGYLQRSAQLIRTWADEPSESSATNIDRHLRLALTAPTPKYEAHLTVLTEAYAEWVTSFTTYPLQGPY